MKNGALLQLVNAKGAGDATVRRLAAWTIHERGTPDALLTMSAQEVAQVLSVGQEVARNILAERDSAARLGDSLDAQGVEIVWLHDMQYPQRLKLILGDDAPPILFMKGNLNLLRQPSVGFCGSRKASERGLAVTDQASRLLAQAKVCVVSGYAHGVDLTAHRSAMEAGGTTIMVLVDGILRFQAKRQIADVLEPNNHLILSQFPPNLPWIGRNAMKRNATIIGLSDAMILVESGLDGGTFAAGAESLKRHHPLFVVEYSEPEPSAEGNPFFLERGGIPLRGNRQRVPNLDRVLDVTRHPRWRTDAAAATTLF